MRSMSERLKERYFGGQIHPYQVFERRIDSLLTQNTVLLDAGCGRSAPLITKFKGKAGRLIGVEVVNFTEQAKASGVELLNNDLSRIDLPSASVDVVISRSVLEHIEDIEPVYREIHRILKPGGRFVFLVPNFWDYVSLLSWMVPNKFHSWIVNKLEGRAAHDVFPTYYHSNTRPAISRLAQSSGFEMLSFDYVGQYPSMFMFNPALFLAGTAYEKLINRYCALHFLKGWILADLRKADDCTPR